MCLKKCIAIYKLKNSNNRPWIFGDQLASHKNDAALRLTEEENAMLWWFPVKASHIVQPLDDVVFATFKNLLASKFRKSKFENTFLEGNGRKALFHDIYEAEQQTFVKKIIVKSFNNCGLVPWNPTIIMDNVKRNAAQTVVVTDQLNQEIVALVAQTVNKMKAGNKRKRESVDTVSIKANEKRVWHSDELQVVKRKKAVLQELAKQQVEFWKSKNQCKSSNCHRLPRRAAPGKNWYFCQSCKVFALCPNHNKEKAKHEQNCIAS